MQEIYEALMNYGTTLIMCGLFVYQYFKQERINEQREEKLYSVIQSVASLLPEISQKLNTILAEIKSDKD